MLKKSMSKHNSKQRTKSRIIEPKPKQLPTSLTINGAKYIGEHEFDVGNSVPIYEIDSMHAFTQLLGHAKFNNQHYGNVYYRGECKLHNSLKPSLYRKCKKIEKTTERLSALIKKVSEDDGLKNTLKVGNCDDGVKKHIIEGVLQHYGIPTRFVDVVDNHWVALWMGNNKNERFKQVNSYYHYSKRNIPLVELARNEQINDEDLFQYVLLMAIPFSNQNKYSGVRYSEDFIEVDLRQSLPSVFLRPHVQHGLVIRKKIHNSPTSNEYDMATTVIGIIKVRVDYVQKWIGNGELLSQNNLFPPPAYDYGYDLLLQRTDLFKNSEYSIAKYI